ncbi:MAG TPA: M56 family metallopeptidase, partial [Flavobacterium sp.]|nr:M56 family metallopeptidase [Flavobacterium sp.]
PLLLYIIKSGGLLAGFFLFYHLLLRKETFFNLNRVFLLSGLVIATVLPLCTIQREITVEKPVPVALPSVMQAHPVVKPLPASMDPQVQEALPVAQVSQASEASAAVATPAVDWAVVMWYVYVIVGSLLVLHVVCTLFSLYRLLRKRQVRRHPEYALVDVEEEIAPFSFFRYIVLNSSLYTAQEFRSILSHERVHSSEHHSFDVLFTRLFCIVFWFNPVIWMYRKAIAQNLEYIADRRAVSVVEDRRAYQFALLRVAGSYRNLSLTNPFYQSLIKKRIVMLNKRESSKKNLWKYALILPLLAAFLLSFQVKLIAREVPSLVLNQIGDPLKLVIDKNTTDAEIKEKTEAIRKEHGITVKVSKVKRNSQGEITGIKVEYKDKKGRKGVSQISSDEPIHPIFFYKDDNRIGFSDRRAPMIIDTRDFHAGDFDFAFGETPEAPEALEAPEAFEVPEAPEAPEAPEFEEWSDSFTSSVTVTDVDGEEPIVIVNGKRIDVKDLDKAMADLDPRVRARIKVFDEDGRIRVETGDESEGDVYIMKTDKIRKKAMEDARFQMKKARIEIEKQRPRMEQMRKEMDEARARMEGDRDAQLAKEREEMQRAKEEMLKAKDELEKAKVELEKARAALKKN